MPAAKRSSAKKFNEMSDEEAIHAARSEMINRSSDISKRFQDMVLEFRKGLTALVAESGEVADIGHELGDKLSDKWNKQYLEKKQKERVRLQKKGTSADEIEDILDGMSEDGDFGDPDELAEQFAEFIDPLDDISPLSSADVVTDLMNAFDQIHDQMIGITEKIREVPSPY